MAITAVGRKGGAQKSCEQKQLEGESSVRQVFFGEEHLAPNEAFTIAVGFPKGVVSQPTFLSVIFFGIVDNFLAFSIPLLALAVCFALRHRWQRV